MSNSFVCGSPRASTPVRALRKYSRPAYREKRWETRTRTFLPSMPPSVAVRPLSAAVFAFISKNACWAKSAAVGVNPPKSDPMRGSRASDVNQASSSWSMSRSAFSPAIRLLCRSTSAREFSRLSGSFVNGRTVRIERFQVTIIASSPSPSPSRKPRIESKSSPRCVASGSWRRSKKRTTRRGGRAAAGSATAGAPVSPGSGGRTVAEGNASPRNSLKFETATALPSWRTSKSRAVRPWTGWPAASVTTTSRLKRFSSTDAEVRGAAGCSCGIAGPGRRRAARRRPGRILMFTAGAHFTCHPEPFSARIRLSGMISFASLFVGLVFGIVNVQLVATTGVHRVELFLDGNQVAELSAPFATPVDLGCDPAPHELVAVARDEQGRQLDSIRQWINRPRSAAEASLVLEPGPGDRGRVARLSWRCLTGEVPRSIAVTFDGRPVPVTDPSRIEVPPHDPMQVHSLRAELDFGGDVRAVAEAIFGGPRRIEAFTEMTAVAVELDEGRSLPPPEQLAGWFEADGALLEVAAVEEGPVEVVLVFEGSALERFRRMYRAPVVATPSGLPEDFTFRFVFPVGQMTAQSTMVSNVYPISRRLGRADGALSWVAGRTRRRPRVNAQGAAARRRGRRGGARRRRGGEAARGRPRPGPRGRGREPPIRRRGRELPRALRVPLHVWSIGMKLSPEAARWGGGTEDLEHAPARHCHHGARRQAGTSADRLGGRDPPAPVRDPDRLGVRRPPGALRAT